MVRGAVPVRLREPQHVYRLPAKRCELAADREPVSEPPEEGSRALRKRRRGATMIEYCMIASLISVAVIAGAQAVGIETAELFGLVHSEITEATEGSGG